MRKVGLYIASLLITVSAGNYNYLDYDEDDNYKYEDNIHAIPIFRDHSISLNVEEKGNIEMSCNTVEPTQLVLLFKKLGKTSDKDQLLFVGNIKIQRNSRFVKDNNVFKLYNATRKDAGTYLCYFMDYNDSKLIYKLDVLYRPSLTFTSPKKQGVLEGDKVTLECEASGNPKPTVKWKKGSRWLLSDADKDTSITIHNVTKKLEGIYVCRANNGVGVPDYARMEILVEYPPTVVTETDTIRTGRGERIEITCIVDAQPTPWVTWFKDQKQITSNDSEITIETVEVSGSETTIKLNIKNISESHLGIYICQAENSRGISKAPIKLTESPKPPKFTSSPTSVQPTSYTLYWETESPYPIHRYTIKYRQRKDHGFPEEWTVKTKIIENENALVSDGFVHQMEETLQDLSPDTEYEVSVRVKNRYEWSDEGKFDFVTVMGDFHSENENFGTILSKGATNFFISMTTFIAFLLTLTT